VVLEMNLNKSPDPIDSFLSAPPMNKIKIGKTDLSASHPWKRLSLAQLSVMMSVLELIDSYLEKVVSSPRRESYACWIPGGEHQSEKVIGEW